MKDRFATGAAGMALALMLDLASAQPNARRGSATPSTASPARTAKPASSSAAETGKSAGEPTSAPAAASADATAAEGNETTRPDSGADAPPRAIDSATEDLTPPAMRDGEGAPHGQARSKAPRPAPEDGKTHPRPSSAAADADAGNSNRPSRGRFVVGLRTGWGVPLGEAEAGSDLSATAKGEFPIWLDLGYRLLPSLMVGVYGQYAFPILGQCAKNADSCTLHDARFGVQAQYSLSPERALDPWLGLGIGYEMLWGKAEASTGSFDARYSGLEYANIQAGADWRVRPAFAAGPFASFSVGEFSSRAFEETTTDIAKTALHHWLVFGIRGNFSL